MKNIWCQKKKNGFNIKIFFSVLILAGAIMWVIYGINIASKANKEQQLEEVKSTIDKAVVLCYAIEGMYPPSMKYLESNYDVNIDESKYIIDYEIFASNIKPQVTVFYVGASDKE